MKTISENLLNRIQLQANEADLIGLKKVADHLSTQIEKSAVREDDVNYVYSSDELQKDIESSLWDASIRVADFYNAPFDAAEVQKTIEATASQLISELSIKLGFVHGVGVYEDKVAGETDSELEVEV
jgi:hypothetical protein